MKIFISWSGEKARKVALALKAFLQDVNQRIIAWLSDTDISAGGRWNVELGTQLETTNYGIICVTQESLASPWVLFESGALSKSVSGGRVCPYLIDVTRGQVSGPLSQFQAKEANREQSWQMLESINLSMGQEALSEDRLTKYFDTFWPTLEAVLIAVNRELQPLPSALRNELMRIVPPIFHRANRLEIYAFEADLPGWKINWNQAAIYVWAEIINVAISEKKLLDVIDLLCKDCSGNQPLNDLREKVRMWEGSLKTDL
ncbi:MAG: toll/interleukin-1 receptor domain-containing protein [Verrucomicrobia bacterium]|nr:toll/interleukin-1 receptor domain-containing protein [Verrucomicrobiota bacterium]